MAKSSFEKNMEDKLQQLQDLLDEIVAMSMDFQKDSIEYGDNYSTLLACTVSVLEMQLRRARMMYVDGADSVDIPDELKSYAFDHRFAVMLWGIFEPQLKLVSRLKLTVKNQMKEVGKKFEEESKSIEDRLDKMAEEESCDCDNCDGKGCSCGCNKD